MTDKRLYCKVSDNYIDFVFEECNFQIHSEIRKIALESCHDILSCKYSLID